MGKCTGASLPFKIEPDAKTGCFGDDGEVAGFFVAFFTVVVDVFDVLVEAEIEFPLMRHLVLTGADASTNVKFAHGGLVGCKIDEGVEFEVIVGSGTFPLLQMVEVVAVDEAEIEVGDGFIITCACPWVDGGTVIDVASACTNLEGVRHGLLFLPCIGMVDAEHLSRHDAVDASNGVEKRTDDFADNTLGTLLGVVEKNVGHAVGDFTESSAPHTCGKKVVDGWTVRLA